MRHRKAHVKLNRSPSHRRAMINNMLLALVEHGRIKTTERRADELRRVAERAIARATRLGDILLQDRDKLDADDKAKLVHAIRITRRSLKDRAAVLRLFDEWAPRFLGRPGGYTRTFKLGNRKGDNARMVLIEFMDDAHPAGEAAVEHTGEEKAEKKGLLARFRKES